MGSEAFVSRPDEAARMRNSRELPLCDMADRFPRKTGLDPIFFGIGIAEPCRERRFES